MRYEATVHHGIPVADSPLGTGSAEGALVFLGRIHPEKGTAEAIARRADDAGIAVAKEGGALTLRDPWGTRIILTQ